LEYTLNLTQFLNQLNDPSSQVEFNDSIAFIDSFYHFTPTAFCNGNVENTAEQNHGSCKILSFGKIHQLGEQQTLRCFGGFYQSVINSPESDNHQNIRQFMLSGWDGVLFKGDALTPVNLTTASTGAN
jgi:hypothetical protein